MRSNIKDRGRPKIKIVMSGIDITKPVVYRVKLNLFSRITAKFDVTPSTMKVSQKPARQMNQKMLPRLLTPEKFMRRGRYICCSSEVSFFLFFCIAWEAARSWLYKRSFYDANPFKELLLMWCPDSLVVVWCWSLNNFFVSSLMISLACAWTILVATRRNFFLFLSS